MTVTFPLRQQIQNHLDHNIFLRRFAGGNHKRQGHKGIVINALFLISAQQKAVALQETDKKRGGDALVAVHEAVVLGDKIQ